MKKIISILLALTLVCGGAVWAVSSLFSMETERDEGFITVSVSLNEEITAENATVLQGELYYDPAVLRPVSVTASPGYGFLTCVISERQPRIQFNCVDEDSQPLILPIGTVVTAEFETLADVDAGLRLEMDLQTADGTVVVDLTENASVTVEPGGENPFTDVPKDSFYYAPVLWAVENGITNGATATTFNPGGDLLRAQVVTMLWRHAGSPVVQIDNPFTDVKEGDWYYNAVLWAVSEGITNGTSSTTFGPSGVTNRAQVVTFLWRYLDSPEAGEANPFEDVDASAWYGAPVLWAVENGITNGMSATEFGVNTNCNRAHMVTFLYRAMN
ncbi:MAG: S-layer homology domain-containing protein [Oscillospiraceae bacterium]|nr:S-layer homology domain-containing protein [Oscillospiraceae bacterium]